MTAFIIDGVWLAPSTPESIPMQQSTFNAEPRWIGSSTIRACFHCAHGIHDGAPRCWHPEVTRGAGPQPCESVREVGGACGPEAHKMQFKQGGGSP